MKSRRAVIALAMLFCACGGTGGSSVTDQNRTLDPKSGSVTEEGGVSAIFINDVAGFCQTITNADPCNPSSLGSQISSITELSISVSGVAPGTYSVVSATGGTADGGVDFTHIAQVQFLATGITGAVIDTAVSGTVTLTTLSAGGSAEGSYDVTMQKGDHLTGTFNADNCPGLANLSSGGPVCNDDTSNQSSCSNSCTCKGKTVKAACTENSDSSWDCTCTSSAGATSTCHENNNDSFVACEQDFGCCPLTF
jgi:hypothetical protein